MNTHTHLDSFTRAYLECALWSSHDNADEDGREEPLDRNYTLADIAPESVAQLAQECVQFQADNEADLSLVSSLCDSERAGHKFWLNRNRHGTGFWDEYYGEDESLRAAFLRLSDASKAWGSCDAYVGDDGQIYFT